MIYEIDISDEMTDGGLKMQKKLLRFQIAIIIH